MKFKHILSLLFLVSSINYSFAQGSSISFPTLFSSIAENAGGINIALRISAAPINNATVEVFVATGGSAANTDFVFSTQTVTFPSGSTTDQIIRVNVNNNNDAQPARFVVLEIRNPVGATLAPNLANRQHILYILDDDLKAPQATQSLKMEFVSSFLVGGTPNTAEILAYDKVSKRLFVVNSGTDKLEILDFANPANIQRIRTIDMTAYGDGSQSVAVKNGIVAVAVDRKTPVHGTNGRAVFFNTNGDFISQVEVGNLPDMITFSPDGRLVMTANEGEPNTNYVIDPEGSISMIDISGGVANLTQNSVTTLNFNAFNGQINALRANGVRIYGAGANPSSVSQDLEPEYITISNDSRKAWVTLQEANAIAVVDLVSKRITDILPLGLKDHTIPSNSFDAADLPAANAGLPVVLSNWKVKGMYQPDAIAYYEVGGTPYLVTANEGDSRDYGTFNEEVRVGAGAYVLDPTAFPNASILKRNHVLGRLTVTNKTGDTDGDGDFDEIHVLGGRSFSIWNANTGALVFDSGNQFELITAANPTFGALFNASNDNNEFKNRSDNKGPEPEGVTVIKTAYNVYAFIALERIGGVMVYEISDPTAPVYIDYINSRAVAALGGDRGAEGIIFIPAEESPNGTDLVLTANETSATVAVYSVKGIERVLFSPNLTANAGSQGVTLSWNVVNGAISYEIYVNSANSAQRLIGTVTGNSFTAANLQNGVTYFFKIVAVSANGNRSDFSNEVSARPSTILGTEEETANALFQVYPNPSNGSFSLQISELKGKNVEISVLDLGGRILYQQSLRVNGNLDTQINLNLASGLYLLQLQTEKDNFKRKLVIER
jgi:Secretion system C-terminal sorting domain